VDLRNKSGCNKPVDEIFAVKLPEHRRLRAELRTADKPAALTTAKTRKASLALAFLFARCVSLQLLDSLRGPVDAHEDC